MTATAKAHQIDATKLAWWAEEAHGKQGTPLYIVVDDKDNAVLTDTPPADASQVLLEVSTKGTRAPLKRPERIVLTMPGGEEVNLLDNPKLPGCDALFWSASSIEKFLFPYYYSQRLFSDVKIEKLRAKYREDKTLVAALHRAPSKPYFLDATDTAALFYVPEEGKGWNCISLREYLG